MIESSLLFLPLVISCIGLLLFVILVLRIREVGEMQKLKKYRSKEMGVADLLNYASIVEDGIIACKNGSLMAAWVYRGEDSANLTDEQREYVSDMLNSALAAMGDGWMIHVDAVRHPTVSYPERSLSHFPDAISEAIDEERRQLFESRGTMYEGYFVLTATWFPPLLAEAKFTDLMFEDESRPASRQQRFQAILESFRRSIQTLESRLSSVLKMTRLEAVSYITEDGRQEVYDNFLQYLQFCITGIRQPVHLPSCPVHLDALLGGQELWGGTIPKIGRNFIQIVAIEGFPQASVPGMLSILTDMDVEYRWSTRFIFLDPHTAKSHIDKYRRQWKQKQRGLIDVIFQLNGPLNADAVAMTQDAENAHAEVESGEVGAGYYTSVLVIMSEDREEVESSALKLQKRIFNLGFAARIESVNTMDAFFGSLPGHGHENVRRPLISTRTLGDLLPSSSIWTGAETAPCPYYSAGSPALCYCVTTGNSPFRLNLHVRDLGHTLIFGPTGSGKSTALALLAMQMRRYEAASIYVFDKGLSMYATTKACGGHHFAIADDSSKLQFCPLQYLDTPEDRAWALDWIDTILALNGVVTGPNERNEIADALLNMSRTGGKNFQSFNRYVQSKNIREALKPYTLEGPMGALLDADDDGLSLASFTTFEMESLLNLGDKWALPVLLYLFRRIEKSLRGQPAFIILDEAWIMLGHRVFGEKIREWFKVLRKSNCALILATQNISDAAKSPIFDVIIESTPTKIFLPNAHARNDSIAEVYTRIGLNKHQIEIIASARAKSEYYLTSEQGSRLFSFALGPLALAFAGASDKETVLNIQKLERKVGDKWPFVWMESKGIPFRNYMRNTAQ
ncbi:VirB4 family type IV secretion/conjugal transfer ATPase [Bilophila wadsworthia]|uniref:VirB4 family type IV secretion/conjugal transfer ATPase n=1 Tax=Bilophila wadsworthia TaxID=35833 RepID=UPI00241F33DA|nr:VirB4 family type IV secretion/conjugal transfer ATPase [Bilophila wadsworthia]